MHCLGLHGSRQSAEVFRHQLSGLESLLEVDHSKLTVVDAPYELPKEEGEVVPGRSWSSPDTGDYTAGDALLDSVLQRETVDVLIGFSQGAVMVARAALRHGGAVPTRGGGHVKRLVFVASPDVCLYHRLQHPAQGNGNTKKRGAGDAAIVKYLEAHPEGTPLLGSSVPSLHVIGEKDAIVSPAESEGFAFRCGLQGTGCDGAAEVYYHSHAHSVPRNATGIKAIYSFMAGALVTAEDIAARESELEMLSVMYETAGVTHLPTGEVEVRVPLVTEEQLEEVNPALHTSLRSITLLLRLPRAYPKVTPTVARLERSPLLTAYVQIGRWLCELQSLLDSFLSDSLEANTEMILPIVLYATTEVETRWQEVIGWSYTEAPQHQQRETDNEEEGKPAVSVTERFMEDELPPEERLDRATAADLRAIECLAGASKAAARSEVSSGETAAGGAAVTPVANGGGTRSGSWKIRIGLVGKPSAGKSTFFNAVIDPASEVDAAKVAAFPFTTVLPNTGTGFAPLRCPCTWWQQERRQKTAGKASETSTPQREGCTASYGHVEARSSDSHEVEYTYRRHPVEVKDVAGLVKGAYAGRGKGNQFLNDLCDADVLVHVVDGAGATEADGAGCAPGQGSVLEDLAWVRAEIHFWIYDNIVAKWVSIIRTPEKLRTMFTGYGSSPSFLDRVLAAMPSAGSSANYTAAPHSDSRWLAISSWGQEELHLFIAIFVRLRFPIVTALNKADMDEATVIYAQLKERYPHETLLQMSGLIECDLLQLRRDALVTYLSGSRTFSLVKRQESGATPALPDKAQRRILRVQKYFEKRQQESTALLPTTGVQDVLAAAIDCCKVTAVFPTSDLACLSASSASPPPIPQVYCYHSGVTVEALVESLERAGVVDGKFVRCELLPVAHAPSPTTAPLVCRRSDALSHGSFLARVLTNKRQTLRPSNAPHHGSGGGSSGSGGVSQ